MDITLHEMGVSFLWFVSIVGGCGVIYALIVRPINAALDKKIERVSKPAREAAKALETNNGGTVGGYIEHISNRVDEINDKQSKMFTTILENRAMILQGDKQFLDHVIELHRREGE